MQQQQYYDDGSGNTRRDMQNCPQKKSKKYYKKHMTFYLKKIPTTAENCNSDQTHKQPPLTFRWARWQ